MSVAISPWAVADQRGVTVVRNRASGNDCAGFVLRHGGHQIIGVNTATSPRRQNWAVARGLGHLQLHKRDLIVWRDAQLDERCGSAATVVEEQEANAYAADLLMSAEVAVAVLCEELGAGHASRDAVVEAVARRFEVSNEVAGWRLIGLGLIAG